MNWKTVLRSTALVGAMLLGGALLPGATAQARDCYDRIRDQEWKLQRDIERHGYYSRQARHDRHELGELRQSCRFEGRRDRRWGGDNRQDNRRWGRNGDRDDRERQWRRRDRRWDGDNRQDNRTWGRDGDEDRDQDRNRDRNRDERDRDDR